jgi:hypothetical protein
MKKQNKLVKKATSSKKASPKRTAAKRPLPETKYEKKFRAFLQSERAQANLSDDEKLAALVILWIEYAKRWGLELETMTYFLKFLKQGDEPGIAMGRALYEWDI